MGNEAMRAKGLSDAGRHAARGPYPVGVLQVTFANALDPARRLQSEIWYPADTNQPITDAAPHPLGLPHLATPALRPIASPCSLIAFSHGNSGLRQQSTFLTTHLASWGHVVVAPDHAGNTFHEMLELADDSARRSAHRMIRRMRPSDLLGPIRALLDEGALSDRLPQLDATRLGVLGHSFGGWTTLKLPALEPRVRALCALAPASEPFVGRRAFDPDELPLRADLVALILAARDDVLVDLDTSIVPLLARLGSRARLEILEDSDHFHFCDGIELLHRMHENNPREGQLRPTRPYSQLRSEPETHTLLQERVTRFFAEHLD